MAKALIVFSGCPNDDAIHHPRELYFLYCTTRTLACTCYVDIKQQIPGKGPRSCVEEQSEWFLSYVCDVVNAGSYAQVVSPGERDCTAMGCGWTALQELSTPHIVPIYNNGGILKGGVYTVIMPKSEIRTINLRQSQMSVEDVCRSQLPPFRYFYQVVAGTPKKPTQVPASLAPFQKGECIL